MALVVFLRGVNVGGNRTFKPSQFVAQLRHLDTVNIGAAGTFVMRKAGSKTALRAELAQRLPFETQMAICDGRDITTLIARAPYGAKPPEAGVVRFISVLQRVPPKKLATPLHWPDTGLWLVRVLDVHRQFIVGEFRREMKAVGYLGGLDRVVETPVTTRNWSTINVIAEILAK